MGHDARIEQVGSRPLAVVRRKATRQELAKVVPTEAATPGMSSVPHGMPSASPASVKVGGK